MPTLALMRASLPDPVRWLLRVQGLAVAVCALTCWAVCGRLSAQAVVLGGMVGLIGSWAYAWRAWRAGGGRHAGENVGEGDCDSLAESTARAARAYRAQLAGEAWRLAVTALAFVAIFAGPVRDGLPALPVLLGFGAAHAAYWAALLRQRN